MKIGLIGFGKMGQAVASRLIKNKYELFVFDPHISKSKLEDVNFLNSIEDIAKQAKIIWLMVPAGKIVDQVIQELLCYLQKDSIIIDGGNSNFVDTIKRYKQLNQKNINFIDCGTSGGITGKDMGFSLMIGGEKEVFEKLKPIFEAISAPGGYEYMGPSGSGHYVKMVHNGIEYSLLQAYAEGFNLLKNNNEYKNLSLEKITKVWNNGSIIRSFILQLSHNIFLKDQDFKDISGDIGENLTGKWTLEEADRQKIPMDLLKKSLEIRKWSRNSGGNYATKVVAMLRNAFGGHKVNSNKETKNENNRY